MPETVLHVYILDVFNSGEFDCSLPYRSLDNARKEACRRLAAELADADQFAESAGILDNDALHEFYELRNNMLELYQQEAYFALLEVFDEWVATNDFDDPTPINFDITQRVVE